MDENVCVLAGEERCRSSSTMRRRRRRSRRRGVAPLLLLLRSPAVVRADCACAEGYAYFPQIQTNVADVIGEYGYCEYRYHLPCRYMWEELARSDRRLDRYECYAPKSSRCDLSLATYYRALFVDETERGLPEDRNRTLVCDDGLRGAVRAVLHYCARQEVCFDMYDDDPHVNRTILFDDVRDVWIDWIERTYDCAVGRASASRSLDPVALLLSVALVVVAHYL